MVNMGLGLIGQPDIIIKRKFRWTFSIRYCNNSRSVSESFVKLASRPNLSIEETEINFLNGKTWIPGKGTWETITVTYYDVGNSTAADLLTWLNTIYEFSGQQASVTLRQASKRADYAGIGTLALYDGCGNTMETWTLKDMWPQAVNFGDLDYSSSEEVTIELTLRYGQVDYVSNCGGSVTRCPCTPC